jgi:hypothetical protein
MLERRGVEVGGMVCSAFAGSGPLARWRSRRGGSAPAVIFALMLLGAVAYYWFVYRHQQAAGPDAAEPAAAAQADDEVTAAADDEEEGEPDGERPLHEQIKKSYGKKLQGRLKNMPE